MSNIMLPSPYEILSVLRETNAEYTFRVAYDSGCEHGQFFELSIPKVGEAPMSVSARGKGWLEFTIRKVGRLTGEIFGLNQGDMIFMRGPYGNSFPVDKFEGKDLVVIAGGTGLAAVRSLVNHYCDNMKEIASLHLIAGFKDIDSVLFADDLIKFKNAFPAVCTLDNMQAEGFSKGLVTDYIKDIPFASFEDCHVVIVGPPPMMNFTVKECLAQGVKETNIWMSFERNMSCAVGKCGHCKINETYVCLEGPIFNYSKAKAMLD